jgi:hypothetical protein
MTRRNGLHWWSCVAGAVVAAALLCENLDGYHNQLGGNYGAELPVINWTHGWPFVGLVRYSPADLTAAEIKAGWRIQPASPRYTSRWPFDGAHVSRVYPFWLFVDSVIAAAIVLGVGVAMQFWTQRLRIANHFSLRSIFGVVTLCAVAAVALPPLMRRGDWRFIVHYSCLTVIALGVAGIIISSLILLWGRRVATSRLPA